MSGAGTGGEERGRSIKQEMSGDKGEGLLDTGGIKGRPCIPPSFRNSKFILKRTDRPILLARRDFQCKSFAVRSNMAAARGSILLRLIVQIIGWR